MRVNFLNLVFNFNFELFILYKKMVGLNTKTRHAYDGESPYKLIFTITADNYIFDIYIYINFLDDYPDKSTLELDNNIFIINDSVYIKSFDDHPDKYTLELDNNIFIINNSVYIKSFDDLPDEITFKIGNIYIDNNNVNNNYIYINNILIRADKVIIKHKDKDTLN